MCGALKDTGKLTQPITVGSGLAFQALLGKRSFIPLWGVRYLSPSVQIEKQSPLVLPGGKPYRGSRGEGEDEKRPLEPTPVPPALTTRGSAPPCPPQWALALG